MQFVGNPVLGSNFYGILNGKGNPRYYDYLIIQEGIPSAQNLADARSWWNYTIVYIPYYPALFTNYFMYFKYV